MNSRFKNKLIIFTFYLKLFLILSQIIKLFYQTYLIYQMIKIKLLVYFKLSSWFIKQLFWFFLFNQKFIINYEKKIKINK